MDSLEKLVREFAGHTGRKPSNAHLKSIAHFESSFACQPMKAGAQRLAGLYRAIANKLQLHRSGFRALINEAAKYEVYFNYNEKRRIENYLLDRQFSDVGEMLDCHGLTDLIPVVLEALPSRGKISEAIRPRSDNKNASQAIVDACFSEYIFNAYSDESMHKISNSDCVARYFESYWDHLRHFHEDQIKRARGGFFYNLRVRGPDSNRLNKSDPYALSELIVKIPKIFDELDNHGYLAVFIDLKNRVSPREAWHFHAELINYAERFLELEVDKGYFHPEKIEVETNDFYKNRYGAKLEHSNFKKFSEAFFYKDTFVFVNKADEITGILILLEKNQRDERIVPCPACRSKNVRGNSYPEIGVRSWECRNPICPDRSKSNRGKRFSLKSVIRQRGISDDRNLIPKAILEKFRLDFVVSDKPLHDAFELFWRCFSLADDTIQLVGMSKQLLAAKHRVVQEWEESNKEKPYFEMPVSLDFWKRIYRLREDDSPRRNHVAERLVCRNQEILCGDAHAVLKSMVSNSFDAGVTSPPYYNARDYSQWPNIYCYLSDMYNVMREVYRVMKSGAPFLFNIFDYFDNEKNLVFSDMGKRRIPLGPLLIQLFLEVGFKISGNIVWYKGHIEGSRNFNQGNLSPYYQLPHNCWEHIYVLSKGEPHFNTSRCNTALRARPVTKIVNGENIFGHSAPFPSAIPAVLVELISGPGRILDPFAGSMTTLLDADRQGNAGVGIEQSAEYCELGLARLKSAEQLSMGF